MKRPKKLRDEWIVATQRMLADYRNARLPPLKLNTRIEVAVFEDMATLVADLCKAEMDARASLPEGATFSHVETALGMAPDGTFFAWLSLYANRPASDLN